MIKENTYIGIDIGGTNIKAIECDELGNVFRRKEVKTPKDNPRAIIESVVDLSNDLDPNGTEPIGLACPGEINEVDGTINADNLGWYDFDINAIVKNLTTRKFTLLQDGQSAMNAEMRAGALKGCKNAIFLAIGTGIGGDAIICGQAIRRIRPNSCEFGHIITHANGKKCSCGNYGCFEQYASASALKSKCSEFGIDEIELFDLVKNHDDIATAIWDAYINELSIGIMSLISAYLPEIVCMGGGISEQKDFLRKSVLEGLMRMPGYVNYYSDTIITTAKFGKEAGAIGAALMVKEAFKI